MSGRIQSESGIRESQKTRASLAFTTLPVFPNWFPFNDMLFDNRLRVNNYAGVKTRNWNWNYRGPVLFYNSSRTASAAIKAYGYTDNPSEHKVIIGIGELVDVRPLNYRETMQMVCNFNNMNTAQVKKILKQNGFSSKEIEEEYVANSPLFYFYQFGHYIAPFDTGFFFKNLHRFKEPVSFNWPSGPIKPIFIPLSVTAKALKKIGINPQTLAS